MRFRSGTFSPALRSHRKADASDDTFRCMASMCFPRSGTNSVLRYLSNLSRRPNMPLARPIVVVVFLATGFVQRNPSAAQSPDLFSAQARDAAAAYEVRMGSAMG